MILWGVARVFPINGNDTETIPDSVVEDFIWGIPTILAIIVVWFFHTYDLVWFGLVWFGLVIFYGISTFLGYLMPNHVDIYMICKWIIWR